MRNSRPPKQIKTTPQVCQALTVKLDKKFSRKFLLWPSYRERAVPPPHLHGACIMPESLEGAKARHRTRSREGWQGESRDGRQLGPPGLTPSRQIV